MIATSHTRNDSVFCPLLLRLFPKIKNKKNKIKRHSLTFALDQTQRKKNTLLLLVADFLFCFLLVVIGQIVVGRRARQSSLVLAVQRLIRGGDRVVLALRRRQSGRAHAEAAASQLGLE